MALDTVMSFGMIQFQINMMKVLGNPRLMSKLFHLPLAHFIKEKSKRFSALNRIILPPV